MTSDSGRGVVVIVDPMLRNCLGHNHGHAVEIARGIRAARPQSKVAVLTGPQHPDLTRLLESEESIEHVLDCFPADAFSDTYRYDASGRV